MIVPKPIAGTERSAPWTTRLPATTLTPPKNAVHGVDGEMSRVGAGLVSVTAFRPSAAITPSTRWVRASPIFGLERAGAVPAAGAAAAETDAGPMSCANRIKHIRERHTG